MKRLAVKQFKGKDGRFFLLKNDTGVARAIISSGSYQPAILRRCLTELSEGDVALDIGSNVGSFTVPFAKAVGDTGVVHAFEPQRIIHQILCGNVCLNGLVNVHTHNFGLSDKNRPARIKAKTGGNYSYFDTMPFTHCKVSDNAGERIELRTLDSLKLSSVTFIKLDIELHEIFCLRGATETIDRYRPTIVTELNKYTEEQKQLSKQVEEFMEEVSYRAEPIMRPNGQVRDVLFRPAEQCA